jgi:hypothetical protein
MKIAARMRMRKAVPPITPPMIAFLEWDVEVEVGGEAADDIVLGVGNREIYPLSMKFWDALR